MSQTSDSKATADKGDADNNWRKSGGKAVGDRDSTVSAGGGVRDSGRGGGGSYRSRDGAANDKVGGSWRGGGGASDKDRGDDRGGSWRGGARNEGRGGNDRGGNDRGGRGSGSDRNNGNDKYSGNRRTEGGGNRSKDEKSASSSQKPAGDRQRLQLKQRTSPGEGVNAENNQTDESSNKKATTQTPSSDKPTEVESPTTQIPAVVSHDETEVEKESTQVPSDEKKEKKKREPEVMNSRAAAMGSVSEGKRESNNRREPRIDRGPPPILNSRFAAMADEEREKNAAEKDDRRSAPHSTTHSRSNRNVDEKGNPAPTNSRFAKAAEVDRSTRDDVTNSKFSKNAEDRGPPLVQNSRFAAAAEADGSGNRSNFSREDRGPPPVQNSRFAAAAEADGERNRSNFSREDRGPPREDRGPPLVQNSRFAAAAEADGSGNRSSYSRDDRGPPPVQNSRFSAVAEADGERNRSNFSRDDRGPPAVQNSRFSAAAEADGSGNRSSFSRDDRGPPVVQNSRFANAAAMAESERDAEGEQRFRNNNDRGSSDRRGQSDMRGPPLQQNSRFAAAAAADEDYVDRANRTQDRDRNDRGGRGDRNDGGGRGSRYGNRDEQPIRDELPRGPAARFEDSQPELSSRVEQLLKPKSKAEETVIIPPTKEHEANMFKIPTKALSRDDDENVLVPLRKKANEKKTDGEVSKPEGTAGAAPISSVSKEKVEALLNEFVHGGKLGEELQSWCENSGSIFPAVEKVVFYLLNEKEKLNPDPDCKWADPAQYGAALLFLVNDDLLNQMQVLWAIQLYCAKMGFPKLDGEYIVQSMFRSMYKFDLVADEAFSEWKDDESDVHEEGKMTAVIQTVEWFNWLEQEEQDEEEEGEEE